MFNVVSVEDVKKSFKTELTRLEKELLKKLGDQVRKDVNADIQKAVKTLKTDLGTMRLNPTPAVMSALPADGAAPPVPSANPLLQRSYKKPRKTLVRGEFQSVISAEAIAEAIKAEESLMGHELSPDSREATMPFSDGETRGPTSCSEELGEAARSLHMMASDFQKEEDIREVSLPQKLVADPDSFEMHGSPGQTLYAPVLDALAPPHSEGEPSPRQALLPTGETTVKRKREDFSMAWNIVNHRYFEPLAGLAVIVNASFVGYETAMQVENGPHYTSNIMNILELVFFIIFSLELTLRILAAGCQKFYCDAGCKWAYFDTFMVAVQLTDLMSNYSSSLVNVGSLRTLRTLRILRIARTIRLLHLFQVLNSVVSSMINAFEASLWALVLLMALIYTFGVFFMQTSLMAQEEAHSDDLRHFFGSVPRTLQTLFEALFGGLDWEAVVNVLTREVNPWLGLAFVGYVTMGMFVILNLVMSIFMKRVSTTIREDKDTGLADQILSIFMPDSDIELCLEDEVMISWQDFAQKLDSQAMQQYFRSIDIEPTVNEARSLFDLLDVQGVGRLSVSEIAGGCLRLSGPARALEMALVLDSLQRTEGTVALLQQNFAVVSASLDAVMTEVSIKFPTSTRSSKTGVSNAGEMSSLRVSPKSVAPAEASPLRTSRIDLNRRHSLGSPGLPTGAAIVDDTQSSASKEPTVASA
eukprot:TRINITY_DN7966_c0_g1_i2.p1 TRINITY_DN7966_c0_g1~~TRINITY_DN7966_c0_g1_i2.p1  ORF type:complete len:699 (+),score=154.35 TRINITY_DN7966_c0_g1_i2:131-2227(+)